MGWGNNRPPTQELTLSELSKGGVSVSFIERLPQYEKVTEEVKPPTPLFMVVGTTYEGREGIDEGDQNAVAVVFLPSAPSEG